MMSQQDAPITGLCIVADPEKCPPGYELIYRSHDKGDDCDLWKDSFFRQRTTRYLCITRTYPLDSGRLNNVLADICILNEKEVPYQGFSMIEKTQDSGEPSLKKKTIAVKMVPRSATSDAITNLIILSKSRRALAGYTLIGGDINGLTICYKMGAVPPETQQNNENQSQQQNAMGNNYIHTPPHPTLPNSNSFDHATAARNSLRQTGRHDSITGKTPVSDVPFQLHPRFRDMSDMSQFALPSTVNYKDRNAIENEFSYSFMVERSVTASS